MNKLFLECVKAGNYAHAQLYTLNMSDQEIFNFIIDQGFDSGVIPFYTFVTFLLLEKETALRHYCAAVLMGQGFVYIEGSESMGLFHARRALELAPNDPSYKEYILHYYSIPDKLLSKQEAIGFAHILEFQDPGNITADHFFQDIKGGIPDYLKEKIPHKDGKS